MDAVVSVVDSAPDVLCIACSFRNDSNARGCHVTLSEEGSDNPQQTSSSLTIFRDVSMSSSTVFLDCLTGLQGKNYSVVVREVKCDGKLANHAFTFKAISIGGKSQIESDTNGNGACIHDIYLLKKATRSDAPKFWYTVLQSCITNVKCSEFHLYLVQVL